MKTLTKKDLVESNATNAANILQYLLKEDDGIVYISLGNSDFAGFQLCMTSDQDLLEDNSLDEFLLYDFLVNEDNQTIVMDEETSGSYAITSIEDVIEYRLNKLADSIE